MSSDEYEKIIAHLVDINRRQQDFFSAEIRRIEADTLSFKLEMLRKVTDLERQVDEVFYVEGGRLAIVEPGRLKRLHKIVLDEFELDGDDRLFYRKYSDSYRSTNETERIARHTLFYMLNKHIEKMTWPEITGIYGWKVTRGAGVMAEYQKSDANMFILNAIDAKFRAEISSWRPTDVIEEPNQEEYA